MGGIGIGGGRGEGAAAAFESVIAAPAVEQSLGQTAIQYSRVRMSAPRCSEEAQADVKLPGAARRRGGIEIDQDRGLFPTEAQFRGVPMWGKVNQRVNERAH